MFVALAAALLGLVTLWVLSPLFGWGNAEEARLSAAAAERESLLARRREILLAIKDLEMEHQIGKLTKEDFEETRERLAAEAIDVLRKLDTAPGGAGQAEAPLPAGSGRDAG